MLGNICHNDSESKELVMSMVGSELMDQKGVDNIEGADEKTKSTIIQMRNEMLC